MKGRKKGREERTVQVHLGEHITALGENSHGIQMVCLGNALHLHVATQQRTRKAGPDPGKLDNVVIRVRGNGISTRVDLFSAVLLHVPEANREELHDLAGLGSGKRATRTPW
jgi:hypothetical protein